MEAAVLRLLLLLLNFIGCLCYLLSTPSHVMVNVGSDANFSCQSSIQNGISWYFKSLDGRLHLLNNSTLLPMSAVISSSDDNITSTLHLRSVGKQLSGTYKCADANEVAFADLTVLDAGQTGGLTLCPTDVIATSGDCVLMRVAGTRGSSLRWYRDNSVIYTSVKMDYRHVDERYFVAETRGGEKNLVIRDVKPTDAGNFTALEVFSGQSALVNLVVTEPDTPRCRRKQLSELDVQFVCEVQYKGWIQPTVQWLLTDDEEPLQGTFHGTETKCESRLTVSAANPASWPSKCQITFNRQSCNEPRSAYTRTTDCHSDDSPALSAFVEFLSRHPLPVGAVAVVVLFVAVVISCVCALLCARRCMLTERKSTEFRDELDSPPPEYEKLRNNGTRESQDVAPPLYATVVNTDNDYEEPVVDI